MRHRPITLAVLAGLSVITPLAPAAAAEPAASGAAEVIPETVNVAVHGLPVAVGAASTAASGGAIRSAPAEAPVPFSMVGLELPEGATAKLRTSVDGERWSEWQAPETMEVDSGPDLGTAEADAAVADPSRFTEPVWVDEARFLQVDVVGGSPADVSASFIDSTGLSNPDGGRTVAASSTVSATAVGRPAITTRAQWGANESLRKSGASYASGVRYAVVHHTAGSNNYSAADGPGVVRGIYSYHTKSLGWSDIGYNFLIDRYGRIYEGRAGGIDRAVIGAHAQGFNSGSVGVSVMGDFSSAALPASAEHGVQDIIAWKFSIHGVKNPEAMLKVTSGGSNKYGKGTVVNLNAITAHRNVGQTACPGNAGYAKMGAIRYGVALRMLAAGAPAPAPKPAPAPAAATSGFADTVGSVHESNINRLVDKGITKGCGGNRFCLNDGVTRAQVAMLINRAIPALPNQSGSRFEDVPADDMYANAIATVVDAGIMNGFGDGTFQPRASLTREQMATVLGRAAKLAKVQGRYFEDVPWTSPHLAYVNAVGKSGISNGCGGNRYCPQDTVLRGQMASFLVRALF